MFEKPTYEELEQRVKKLEQEFVIRKQAEEALREREATLRSIFRAAPAGIGTVCDRVIRQANERLCEMVGYSQEELLGQNARILYPSDADFEYVGREKYAQISKQGIGTVETRLQCKDGKVVDVLLSSALIDPNDWSTGVTFTALDITKRRQAEEALKQAHDELERRVQKRTAELEKSNALLVQEIKMHKQTEAALLKSEATYRDLYNNAQVGLFQSRVKDGKILECNEKFAQIFGYKTREKCCADCITAEHYMDPGERERALAVIKETGRFENYETYGKRRDGSRAWVRYSGVLRREEGFLEGVMVDITEEKRAEEALRESEERFRAIFETAQDSIFIKDRDLKYTFVNPSMERLFKTPSSQLVGKSDEELFGDDAGGHIRDVDSRVLKGEIIDEEDTKPMSGVNRTFHVIKVPIRDDSGEIVGLCGIARDITKQKQAEEALQKREAELEIQSQHLQEVNSALKVLLQQRKEDKKELQENIIANVKELVAPYLDKLSQGKLDERQKSYIGLAQANLNDIISPFIGNLSSKYLKLTPTEIQVASLIKHGKTTKEIAELLNLAVETIKFHRKNIRGKIGIKNKKINLRTCLASMQGRGGEKTPFNTS